MVFSTVQLCAQGIPACTWGNMPDLHVEGKHLVDEYGNKVVLHGVMDTPSPYFNNNRWKGPGWGESFNTTHAKNAIAYFDMLFTALTDTTQGAYCNLFRLHLDPCWTNLSTVKAPGFTEKNGKVYDPHGNEVGGEANIYNFSQSRLKAFLKTLYFPIAKKAIEHGMYVIMRPPGVFPGYVEVGDYYNDYIKTVWDIVTQNDSIKKYSGKIMIELGNEPVTVRNAQGKDDDKALCQFFQPVVDKIRENGYEGVVWGVGSGWQGNYRPYAKYPIIDDNLGYAVHNYVGWYGGHDDTFWTYGGNQNYPIASTQGKKAYANEFHASVPIMDTNPIVITEIDWSPEKEGTGHYNEHGDWVLSNYGTWATGSTSKWGAAYKYLLDTYDNISMTLSGTSTLIDIDVYQKTKKVVPAFADAMKANGLDPWEASGTACLAWYKEFAKQDYARPDLSKPSTDPGLAVTQLESEDSVITKLVGQYVTPSNLIATFACGMTSKIPANMLTVSSSSNCFTMKEDALVTSKTGEAEMNVSYTDPLGNTLSKPYKVNVLPALSTSAIAFDPSISLAGTYSERTMAVKTGVNGLAGWRHEAGLDASKYNYLVVKLRLKATGAAPAFCIYNSDKPGDECYKQDFGSGTTVKIDLHNMQTESGKTIDPANIHLMGFTSNGSASFFLKEIYFSNDGENPVPEAVTIEDITELIAKYLEEGSTVTITDITELIAKYLEQE